MCTWRVLVEKKKTKDPGCVDKVEKLAGFKIKQIFVVVGAGGCQRRRKSADPRGIQSLFILVATADGVSFLGRPVRLSRSFALEVHGENGRVGRRVQRSQG